MTGFAPHRQTLLVVDDEADILVALEDLFEDRYEVIASTSPQEALARLASDVDVAVILSDQRMPGMTGDAFLAEARKLSDASAILLTGYADLSAVTAALNQGGIVGYAAKPWEPDALKAMVAGAAEQHRLKRALRHEQALLRGLMDHLPYAVAFKDAEGRYVQVNRQKAGELGLDFEQVLGRSEAELGRGEPTEAELQALRELRPVQAVVEDQRPGGPAWLQLDYVPLIDPDGRLENLVVMERDITDQRMAELQLRQSDKLRALGTLAGGVAHDFNNLLTAIVGSLELASRRIGNEQAVRRYLDNATLAAQRGASLTQRLLGFSRRSDGRPATTDLGLALTGMRDLLTSTLGRTAQVELRIAPDLWPASVEADQFELAVMNLAINARDAMPEGGVISIAAANVSAADRRPAELAAGEHVVVSISDTGEGMSPEILDRILEPFFTTKPVGKGTGLGLPMVYGFAQRSGGALDIHSEAGVGTVVSLYLPRAVEQAPEEAPAKPAALTGRLQEARILVVDDEPAVRAVTAASLRDLGHQVLEADGAETALELLRNERGVVDLALVDYAMPGLNGIDFTIEARRLRPGLPVILLTGYFDVEAAPGDVAVMHKPFSQQTLASAIGGALRVREPQG